MSIYDLQQCSKWGSLLHSNSDQFFWQSSVPEFSNIWFQDPGFSFLSDDLKMVGVNSLIQRYLHRISGKKPGHFQYIGKFQACNFDIKRKDSSEFTTLWSLAFLLIHVVNKRAAMKLVTDFDCVSGCNICIYLSTSLIILIFWARSSSNIPEKHMLPRDHKHMDDQLHYNEALVFPGRTSHTRVLPKVHSFLYAFLIIAVPIRNCKSNWFAAIDNKTKLWWRRGWLQVDSPDHLHRGDDKRGLSHKLDQYLESKVHTFLYDYTYTQWHCCPSLLTKYS